MVLANAIAPALLVLPVALLAILVLGAHVVSVSRSDMPASRRRIRMANGMLMMFAVPLAAYAFGFADPQTQQREFALAWMMVAGLLVLIIAIAVLDVINTFRLHLPERAKMREELRAAREALESAPRSPKPATFDPPTTPA